MPDPDDNLIILNYQLDTGMVVSFGRRLAVGITDHYNHFVNLTAG
jgi:hypothetical protein